MRSTASDFARLLLMIMGGGALEGAKVLEPGSVKQMITPTGFRNHDGWTQGLGIMGPEDLRGRQVWGHDGQEHGASTAMFFNPKTGVGAVAFANAMDAGWTLNYVLDDLDLHLMAAFE
jgi:CubicO group peptidase (beta-lactamase class C family)